MVKVMNVVFGVGIAIVLYLLIILGIKAFNPEPEYSDFCPEDLFEPRAQVLDEETRQQQIDCRKQYNEAREEYNEYAFLVASIVGTILLIISGYLMFMINISAGVAVAGLTAITYGFIRGWSGTNDKLKFFVALIVSIIVVVLGVIINKKMRDQRKKH